jgi:hypothetical protein
MLDEWDAVAAAPQHHRVLFEDNRVRVLETLIQPGEETNLHTHIWGGYLLIMAWDDAIRYDDKKNVLWDSKASGYDPQIGSVVPASPIPIHSFRNVGKGPIHLILTEMKE